MKNNFYGIFSVGLLKYKEFNQSTFGRLHHDDLFLETLRKAWMQVTFA